jgi:cytochrome c oxidase cbb3-type subunit IV
MTIEISIVRGILTLVLMLAFITLVVWLYGKRNKSAFDQAARLPLEEDELPDVNQHGANPRRSGSQQS